jgi:hypothetical protein
MIYRRFWAFMEYTTGEGFFPESGKKAGSVDTV